MHPNTLVPEIQSTREDECETTLPFLDVLITREAEGRIEKTVCRKPTPTVRILNYTNNHPKYHLGSCSRAHRIPPSQNRQQHNRTVENRKKQTGKLVHCRPLPRDLHLQIDNCRQIFSLIQNCLSCFHTWMIHQKGCQNVPISHDCAMASNQRMLCRWTSSRLIF